MDPLHQEVGYWWISLASLPCCSSCNPHYKDIKNPPPPPPPTESNLPSSSSLATMTITQEPQFHILAVDDSLLDRKLIEKLLRTSSYQVTTVDSGSKALEFLGLQGSSVKNEMEVSLIITDYCMPGMTGYDLLKRIKESAALRDIPVVIMSSENVPSRINRCLEEGAEEFFLKPVQLADMTKLRPHILKCKSKEQLWPNGITKNSSNQSSKRKAMDDVHMRGKDQDSLVI